MSTTSLRNAFYKRNFFKVFGPGLVVMLADTDAGSVITAAQSGAQVGYKLILLQVILIPILFVVQELTVRLAIATGRGHAQLIRDHYGKFWAWISVITLMFACFGALLTELSGMAGVANLFGAPTGMTLTVIVIGLTLMAITGSYRSVEYVAIAIGAFELLFIVVAIVAKPDLGKLATQMFDIPIHDSGFLYLAAANIGAVIMPWMVFYQQSAVVEKGLTRDDLPAARLDTAIGSVLTQLIMVAVMVAAAAAFSNNSGLALDRVEQIAAAFTPVLGEGTGKVIFALGMAGAALVATIVVTLTAARTLGELLEIPRTLDKKITEAPWFYGIYAAILCLSALIVGSGIDLVQLSVSVQVMNAIMLPFVLGFLLLLARKLPQPWRLQGPYALVVTVMIALTSLFALYASLTGLIK